MRTGPVPDAAEVEAPAHWRAIDFISDLHLAETTPRTFAACAGHLFGTDADAVFILGDLFEVWIGDDTRSRDFERRCVAMLHQASRHRTIGFMAGNRDFLVGPAMLADCGVERLNDPTALLAFGRRWLLTHGDALCLEDTDYQAFRHRVRDTAWQQGFLARPIDERAAIAQAIRSESQARKTDPSESAVWADVDTAAALAWLDAGHCVSMIHGHTHRPGQHVLTAGHDRHVLSDWDCDHAPARADVLRLDARGLHRVAPADAR